MRQLRPNHQRRTYRGSKPDLIKLLWAAALLLVLQSTQIAAAQSTSGDLGEPLLPVRLDAHGVVSWDGLLGFGARADYRLMERTVVGNRRDELAVSGGVDILLLSLEGSNPLEVWPTGTLQWSLGVSERFAFYPELGLTARIDRQGFQGVFPNVGFGGRYYVWRSVSVMARFGWPMALSLGATF